MEKVSKFFGIDNSASQAAARQAAFARQLADLEGAQVRRREAETSGQVAAITNRRARPSFLASTGFKGLRTRLGGPRQS